MPYSPVGQTLFWKCLYAKESNRRWWFCDKTNLKQTFMILMSSCHLIHSSALLCGSLRLVFSVCFLVRLTLNWARKYHFNTTQWNAYNQALSQEFFSGCPNFFQRGESARLRASAPKNQHQHNLHKNGAIVIVAYILKIDVWFNFY
jgi:hypothetical protein